jgi:hypothetical protein
MNRVQSKLVPSPSGPQHASFVERLFYYALDSNLNRGKMSTVVNGRIVPLADAQGLVAHARAHGWLPPEILGDHNDGEGSPNSE